MKQTLNDSHFELLGLSRQPTNEDIKKAFRKQSMLWHPDKFSNDKNKWDDAHNKYLKILEAYELLKKYYLPKTKVAEKINRNNFKSNNKTEYGENGRIKVKSSNVNTVGYNSLTKTLQVEFKSGSIYEYYEVPEEVYIAFMNAESKGKFGISNIFYKYKFKQI